MKVLGQTPICADPSSELAICLTPFSHNAAVETLGTSVGQISVEELEERWKKRCKPVPAEVLHLSDSEGDDLKLPPGFSLSPSSMSLGIFGILDLVDKWLRDNVLMEPQHDFADEGAQAPWVEHDARKRAVRDSKILRDKVSREPFWTFTEDVDLFSEDSQ